MKSLDRYRQFFYLYHLMLWQIAISGRNNKLLRAFDTAFLFDHAGENIHMLNYISMGNSLTTIERSAS